MKITVNGQNKELSQAVNLKNIIETYCKNTQRVIAEVNGQIVKCSRWEQIVLNDGDTIELVSFVGGG